VHAISGLDLVPVRVWLDDQGRFFGVVNPWFSFVRSGWQSAIDPLYAIQKTLQTAREERLSRALTHRPPEAGLAFVHARVFDADKKVWLTDQTVVVKGERIQALGPSAKVKPAAGAELIDATGKALLPGLWDMHVHFGAGHGELDVASGVTSVRDVGNTPDDLDDYKQRIDQGKAIGPEIVRGGVIEGRGEVAMASTITAETQAEARAAVELYAKRGYDEIKIYNSVKPELVPIIATEAHAKGMRVSGHVPVHMLAEDAVRAGFDELQHINMVLLNFLADRSTDTRTLLRFTLVANGAAGLDLGAKPVKDFIALLREKKTAVCPTLVVFEWELIDRPGEIGPDARAIADRVPVQIRRSFLTGGLEVPPGKDQLFRDSFAATLRTVKVLRDAGVPVLAGTDSWPGLILPRELELLVAAGLPAGEVLQTATLGAARMAKRDKRSGSIAVGKDADLMLVDGDPLANIGDVRKVVTVLRRGLRYDSAALFEAMGVKAPSIGPAAGASSGR
jgi:hypothetical protein